MSNGEKWNFEDDELRLAAIKFSHKAGVIRLICSLTALVVLVGMYLYRPGASLLCKPAVEQQQTEK